MLHHREDLMEMPLEDPSAWGGSVGELELYKWDGSTEQLEPTTEPCQTDEKRLKKSDRSKKRKKMKKSSCEKSMHSEKAPSVTEVVKESFSQMELYVPSKDVRKKLRLLNTELKTYFFKKHELRYRPEQLDISSRSRTARSRPTLVYSTPKGPPKKGLLALARSSRSLHAKESELTDLIDHTTNDRSTSRKKCRGRTKPKKRRDKKSRSRAHARHRKSHSPTQADEETPTIASTPTRTEIRKSPNSSRSLHDHSNDSESYEGDIDEELSFRVDTEKVMEGASLEESERRLRVAGTALLHEVETLQARLRQLRHINAAA